MVASTKKRQLGTITYLPPSIQLAPDGSIDLGTTLQKIHDQAVHMRELKKGGAPKNLLVKEIFKHLELKFLYCLYSPEPVVEPKLSVPTENKTIKLRWKIQDPETGEVERIQFPFYNTVRIPSSEVIKVVEKLSRKRFPNYQGILKIEVIEKSYSEEEADKSAAAPAAAAPVAAPIVAAPDAPAAGAQPAPKQNVTKVYRALLKDNDFVYMPLKKPGPVLGTVETVELRVTWQNVPAERAFPKQWAGLNRVPELIDAGVNLFEHTFDGILPRVIDNAFATGISQLLSIGTNPKNSAFTADLADFRPGSIFATAGVHPCCANEVPFDEKSRAELSSLYARDGVVGVGECGLQFTEEDTP